MSTSSAFATIDTSAECTQTEAVQCLLQRGVEDVDLVPSSGGVEQRDRAVAAKLGLPHQGFVLARPRLRTAIEPVRGGGVVTLVAGPGCGKTAFMADVLRTAEGRAVYFSLDEGDRDPVRFLSYLKAGLSLGGRHAQGDEARTWPAQQAEASSAMELTAELMDAISAESSRPTVIAIDDFHLVDSSPEVVSALGLIVRGLPPGWTILMSSRRPLPLDLEAVALGGRLVALDARQLRLTPREVAAWAAQNWGLLLESPEARSLWRLSEGWPAALVLLGQQLVSRGSVSHADLASMLSRGKDLRAYLERHILAGLEPLAAEVMLAGALLPRLIFPRDEAYLPGEPGAAEVALEELVARGFLVTRSGRRTFTVHPLVRAYAERQAWSSNEGAAAISRAAAHLEKVGEHHRAAALYLRAGRLDDAARPLRALALGSLSPGGDLIQQGWTVMLPDDDEASTGPWLLVARAAMLQREGKYAAAAALYDRAARLLSIGGDDEGLLKVLLGSVHCLFNLGRWENCLDVVKRCRSLAKEPLQRVEVLVVEGNILMYLCRWDEAVEDWEKALALTPAGKRDLFAHRVNGMRARLFFTLGHYRLAMQWAGKSVARGDGKTLGRATGLNTLAAVAAIMGDYAAAERAAEECRELVEARGYSVLIPPLLTGRAMVAQGVGDYRGAVRLLKESLDWATAAGESEGCFRAEDMLGDLSRRNRNVRRALEHHRKALALVDEHHLSTAERVQALAGVGIDLAVQGKHAEALASLDQTVRLCRRWSLKASLSPALFYLGWLLALSGRELEAARCLNESMSIAQEHGHVHFFSQEARVATPILALCDRVGAGAFIRGEVLPHLPPRLAGYFHELAGGKTYPTDVPLGPPSGRGLGAALPASSLAGLVDPAVLEGIQALTDREREVLKMIALGMPNKQIGAKLFISEKTVKTHANHVFHKLGVTSRVQATLAFQTYQRARRAGGAGAGGAGRTGGAGGAGRNKK